MTPADDPDDLFRDLRIFLDPTPRPAYHFIQADRPPPVRCSGEVPVAPPAPQPRPSSVRGTTPEGAPIVWREGEVDPVSPSQAGMETVE